MRFATATAVELAPVGGGRFDAAIAPGWDIVGNANGGYLLAIAGRAMAAAAGRPDPVTVTGHFLSPGVPGPLAIDTAIVKAGKRFTTVSATMTAERPVLTVLGTFGELGASDEVSPISLIEGEPPDLPAPEACAPIGSGPGGTTPAMMRQIELRLHPDDDGFSRGAPSGHARVRGWLRLLDDEPLGTLGLLFAVDAFPPTIFNAALPVAWTPTVELTAHVRARPAPGWLRCSFATRFVTSGFLEVDGEVWDETGALVAQSRQLALVPRPGG